MSPGVTILVSLSFTRFSSVLYPHKILKTNEIQKYEFCNSETTMKLKPDLSNYVFESIEPSGDLPSLKWPSSQQDPTDSHQPSAALSLCVSSVPLCKTT